MIDTNVLIHLTNKNSNTLKTSYIDFVLNNEIFICDTIYYEFLRNCNEKTYRNRVFLFQDNYPTISTLRDSSNFFKNVWCLYLYALRNDPNKLLSIGIADIRIAACCIENKIDLILTENKKDFPDELFEKEEIKVGSTYKYALCRFERKSAQRFWKELKESDFNFIINTNSLQ